MTLANHIDDICIGILNWNRCHDLLRLIGSIYDSLSYLHHSQLSLLVVDNASSDDSVAQVEKKYPKVIVLRNETNRGGSGGFNTALTYAMDNKFRFVWLLDNDAFVLPGALEGLLEAILRSQHIGVVGSKILHADDHSVVCEAGAKISRFTARTMPEMWNEANTSCPDIVDVDYVAACSLLARVDCVRKVGLLDEAYFLLWDDMDWGLRFKRNGYRVVAALSSEVVHPGFSERNVSEAFLYYAARNHLYFVMRNYSGLRRWFYVAFLTGVQRSHEKVFRREIGFDSYADAIVRGITDFFKGQMGKYRNPPAKKEPKKNIESLIPEGILSGNAAFFVDAPISVIKPALRSLSERGLRITLVGSPDRALLFREYDYFPHRGGILGTIGFLHILRKANVKIIIRFESVRRTRHHFVRDQVVVDESGAPVGMIPQSTLTYFKLWFGDVSSRLIGFASGFLEGLAARKALPFSSKM